MLDPVQRHPAVDPPVDGGRFVGAQIVPVRAPHQHDQLADPLLRLGRGHPAPRRVPGAGDLVQLGGDRVGRQREVGPAAVDGAPGHPVELGGRGVLREGDAADLLDRLEPERSVGAGARQHDADGARGLILGQGAEEVVDRQVRAPAPSIRDRHHLQGAVQDGQVGARGDDVHVVRLDAHPVLRGLHRGGGRAFEEAGEKAVLRVGQVLDDDHRRRVQDQVLEEGRQRLHAPGRRAHADDEEPVPALAALVVVAAAVLVAPLKLDLPLLSVAHAATRENHTARANASSREMPDSRLPPVSTRRFRRSSPRDRRRRR
jgi:hypothetical protein